MQRSPLFEFVHDYAILGDESKLNDDVIPNYKQNNLLLENLQSPINQQLIQLLNITKRKYSLRAQQSQSPNHNIDQIMSISPRRKMSAISPENSIYKNNRNPQKKEVEKKKRVNPNTIFKQQQLNTIYERSLSWLNQIKNKRVQTQCKMGPPQVDVNRLKRVQSTRESNKENLQVKVKSKKFKL